jgi:ketosteroid isomerase-like protein
LARIGATLLLLLSLCWNVAAQGPSSDLVGPIRKVLDDQVAAWNRHDLEGFMAGSWKSPELTFFSGGTELRGWEATLERYRQRYQSEGREMGKLDFAELRIEPLGAQAAFVHGRFHLVMKDGKEMGGVFTLIVRKFPQGWKIVHDHTSSAP